MAFAMIDIKLSGSGNSSSKPFKWILIMLITKNQIDWANKILAFVNSNCSSIEILEQDDTQAIIQSADFPYVVFVDSDKPKEFWLQSVTIHHGCSYMPNGDTGYPNEEDIHDIQSFDSFEKAVVALIKTGLSSMVDQAIECLHFDEMYQKETTPNIFLSDT